MCVVFNVKSVTQFFFARKHALDIFALQETWLRDGDELEAPGFLWEGRNRQARGGGTGFLVSNTLRYKRRLDLECSGIEFVCIELQQTHFGVWLTIRHTVYPHTAHLILLSAMPLTERDLIWFVKYSEIYGFDCFQKTDSTKTIIASKTRTKSLILGYVCSSNIEYKRKQELK